jgi:lipopolysaccharide biosynthesis regulator YciM
MDTQILDIFTLLTAPLAGVIGWFAGRRKQKNDFLNELQASIDLLATKNKELLAEVIALRGENLKLRFEVEELNRKLEGIKTITRKQ